MKTLFFKSLAFSLILLSLWSCKKDENQSVANAGTSGSLKSSVSTVVLDRSMLDKNVISFDLSNADFGYQAAITNVLQIAVKGTNFTNPKETILAANAKSVVYNGLDFNNLLLSLSLSTSVNTDVEVRVKSSISNTLAPVYSNVVNISAKPFPLTSWIYVPGNYQGWNPATADSLVSITGNGIYTGIIKFDGGNFKITPQKKWDIAYGDAGGGKISTSGGDINSVSAGMKQVTVDLNANTIKIEAAKVWSLIGDATPGGWGSDTDMKVVNDGTNATWKATANFVAGNYKFRYNYDWGTNLGGSTTNLTLGGSDIAMATPGNYSIVLTVNYNDPTDKTKATGGTYTLVKN